MLIRRETARDADVIRTITTAAFASRRPPGQIPPEARLIDELRVGPAWLPALSLVALTPADEAIGHVLGTRGHVGQDPVLALGPLTVCPERQQNGVGSALMHALLGVADALGEPLVALLGDPAYYRRFGFELSTVYQIIPPKPEWLPDGSSADLELTGAGPHHMPYDQLWAVDDQGTCYAVRFDGCCTEAVTWFGVAWLSPVPPRHVRRLDLVGDGTRLVQLPLGPDQAPPGRRTAPPATEPVATGPGERLLMLEAERILASADARGPVEGPGPGEIITVLTEAGAIAAGSPIPGQLAALCQRLGAAGHGITVPPAAEIPAPWASVIAHREVPEPAGGTEMFAPLACILPDMDGARLALAGLSTAAGESHLHVISSGLPRLARRYQWDWTPGLSWWLRDSSGNWHVATAHEPRLSEDGMGAYQLDDGMQAFWLRLTPPLATIPDTAEIVVTGPATRVRATVPVHPAGS